MFPQQCFTRCANRETLISNIMFPQQCFTRWANRETLLGNIMFPQQYFPVCPGLYRKYTYFTRWKSNLTILASSTQTTLTIILFNLEPGPPSKLHFPTITTSVVVMSWAPPEMTGGNITQYRVSYRPRDDGTSKLIIRPPVASKIRSESIPNLSPDKYYVFEVQAYTALGWGEKASAEIFTGRDRSKSLYFFKNFKFKTSRKNV